jgi:hypothetical protein
LRNSATSKVFIISLFLGLILGISNLTMTN